MMDDLLRRSAPSTPSGRHSGRRSPETDSERLMALEYRQDDHEHRLEYLTDELRRLGRAQREAEQTRKARDQIKSEIKEARRNALSVLAVLISAGMLAVALTKFASESRPPSAPLSATTVPGRG